MEPLERLLPSRRQRVRARKSEKQKTLKRERGVGGRRKQSRRPKSQKAPAHERGRGGMVGAHARGNQNKEKVKESKSRKEQEEKRTYILGK